jgi:hypothetical protein
MTAPVVEAAVDPRPWPERHRRALVIGSRTTLLMLFIAGLAMLGLGLLSFLLTDPPEIGGWLRSVFGEVFGTVAFGLAFVIGVPAAVGLAAMSGASIADASPALSPTVRRAFAAVAIATVAVTAVVLLTRGSGSSVINFGLLGLVALASFGLAGATWFSPHRARAALSSAAVVVVAAATVWVLWRAFLGGSA